MPYTAVSSTEAERQVMTIRDAGLLALETALNQYLSLDPEISSLFSALHGKVIAFDLRGTGIKLYFIPAQNSTIQVMGDYEGEPDCMISGSPFSLLQSHLQNNSDAVFSGDIEITGSSRLAQEFTGILKRIDIDWEEHLSGITGDIIAHQVGEFFKTTASWIKRNQQSSELNLKEYLQEEIRLTPGSLEMENFFNDVDQLRDDVERLAARVKRLKSKQEAS